VTTDNAQSSSGTRRPRWGIILAAAAVALVIAVTTIVLIVAGGDKTGDGTGRNQQTSESSLTTGTATTMSSP